MKMFLDVLRSVSDRLQLPQPEKSRILLEIAGDLKDIYEAGINDGLGDEEAAKRAVDIFDVSEEALEELVRIHESGARKFLAGLSSQAQTRWERTVLVVLILFIAVFSGREFFTSRLFSLSGLFIWPVAVFSLLGVATVLSEVYKLFIKKEYDVRKIRGGPVPLLVVACASILTGLTGSVITLFRTSGRIAAGNGSALQLVVEWALGSSALMMVSLMAAIAAAVSWFLLDNKVRRIEEEELAWLYE